METVSTNYKKIIEIQEELRNVKIDNHLKFDYQGDYKFNKCEYCDGPLLGHMAQKCPMLDHDKRL